eukprot:scaffold222815_cov25-Tisochrysis_lutea.AAC.1
MGEEVDAHEVEREGELGAEAQREAREALPRAELRLPRHHPLLAEERVEHQLGERRRDAAPRAVLQRAAPLALLERRRAGPSPPRAHAPVDAPLHHALGEAQATPAQAAWQRANGRHTERLAPALERHRPPHRPGHARAEEAEPQVLHLAATHRPVHRPLLRVHHRQRRRAGAPVQREGPHLVRAARAQHAHRLAQRHHREHVAAVRAVHERGAAHVGVDHRLRTLDRAHHADDHRRPRRRHREPLRRPELAHLVEVGRWPPAEARHVHRLGRLVPRLPDAVRAAHEAEPRRVQAEGVREEQVEAQRPATGPLRRRALHRKPLARLVEGAREARLRSGAVERRLQLRRQRRRRVEAARQRGRVHPPGHVAHHHAGRRRVLLVGGEQGEPVEARLQLLGEPQRRGRPHRPVRGRVPARGELHVVEAAEGGRRQPGWRRRPVEAATEP